MAKEEHWKYTASKIVDLNTYNGISQIRIPLTVHMIQERQRRNTREIFEASVRFAVLFSVRFLKE